MRVLACWLLFCVCLQAQQYVFRTYRQSEGLNNLGVNALALDGKGFLWAGTENGLYRFLGTGFERFGPERGIGELFIRSIAVDAEGTVWVGTSENLYRSEGQGFVPAGGTPIKVTAWNRMAVEDSRHLLIVDGKRLYRLEHDEQGRMLSYSPVFPAGLAAAKPFLSQINDVSVVSSAHGGIQVWMGSGSELYSWTDRNPGNPIDAKNAEFTEWGGEQGLGKDTWQKVMLSRSGAVWAGGLLHVAELLPGAARFFGSQRSRLESGKHFSLCSINRRPGRADCCSFRVRGGSLEWQPLADDWPRKWAADRGAHCRPGIRSVRRSLDCIPRKRALYVDRL